MNRTEFIGTNLYYSQDFVDDLYKEIYRLTAKSTHYETKYYNEAKKVDDALDYIDREMIDNNVMCYKISQMDVKELVNILKGEK